MEQQAQALVLLAEGFEEIEATCPIDLLRRAGIQTLVVSCGEAIEVVGRSGISIKADALLADTQSRDFNLLVLPGGPAVFSLRDRNDVLELIRRHHSRGATIGAICAAPLLLHDAGILNGARYTAHETVSEELTAIDAQEKVVVDGGLVTSRGAGTALEFSLRLISEVRGVEAANEIGRSIHYPSVNPNEGL